MKLEVKSCHHFLSRFVLRCELERGQWYHPLRIEKTKHWAAQRFFIECTNLVAERSLELRNFQEVILTKGLGFEAILFELVLSKSKAALTSAKCPSTSCQPFVEAVLFL